ncbi:hypothetical protein [Polaromonas sp. AER18D-145]|uniref:hypothetical protein n=1 Tax=Polaromonas sp. AER18D-145 TaxID=1977060 RepID=UPI00114180EF|nr:hypothetical protein [Polaromonas sp. AER18D-145]
MKKVLHPCACCKAVCSQRKEEKAGRRVNSWPLAVVLRQSEQRSRMRDPAGGRVQCELGGRGRELEKHDQHFKQLVRN